MKEVTIEGVVLNDLCASCIPILESVGDFIISQVGKVNASSIEEKSKNSLVSYVDKEAEKSLVQGLSQLLPDSIFLTEEETVLQDVRGLWKWVIDPLDGTTNFLYGLPNFAISVGLMYKDEVVLGLVYEVNRKELFYAWKGGGAFCNGIPIRVRNTQDLGEALVATGFPYSKFETLTTHFSVAEDFQRKTRGIRRWGAAAIDLCFVACGRFDVFFENTLNPWDVVAGILIVQEAGGLITDFRGVQGDFSGKEVLASNGYLHAQALEIIRARFYPDSV